MRWKLDDLLKHPKRDQLIGVNNSLVDRAKKNTHKVDILAPVQTKAETAPSLAPTDAEGRTTFSVTGAPIGKPRMSQRDRWMKRPCVLRYRDYCDRLRAGAPPWLESVDVYGLSIVSYMVMPESWSKKKKAAMVGKMHRAKPDGDNILKSVGDALFKEDSGIAKHASEKYWCATEAEERTEVTVSWFAKNSVL